MKRVKRLLRVAMRSILKNRMRSLLTSLGVIIGVALVLNLLCAALAGVSIPIILRKLGIDPALAGGVVLTTVTDVIGFLAFLGLGTLMLV